MYLRRYQQTKDGKRHAYLALVESQRTERGPRRRIGSCSINSGSNGSNTADN